MKQVFYFVILLLFASCGNKIQNSKLSGSIFGTFYEVTYSSEKDYSKQFDSLFQIVNKSMSTYQQDSDISKINRNEDVFIDEHFKKVFEASRQIYEETNAVFDPTLGAVVNAWDFGPEGKIINLDSLKIDSLMLSVGFNKISLKDDKIIKPEGTFLDFNAIAKGYAVDMIGHFLESKNIENYLVNIGGELTSKGINIEKKSGWKVGIEHPNFDGSQSFEKVIEMKNESMATSGTYRKFKLDSDGNRYAHIIDAKTGYPSKTNLLSISVIANDCMTADAYATAFQAMGIEKIKALLTEHSELKVFLIFENDQKEFETLALNGFPEN